MPYSLGIIKFEEYLCDSGAFINVMFLSIFRKFEGKIGVIKSIPMSLQLADQTTIISEGVVEDVLVQVNKFAFPMNFIAVNIKRTRRFL